MSHCPWIVAIMSRFNDRVKNLSKHLRSQENLDRVFSITEMYTHSSSRLSASYHRQGADNQAGVWGVLATRTHPQSPPATWLLGSRSCRSTLSLPCCGESLVKATFLRYAHTEPQHSSLQVSSRGTSARAHQTQEQTVADVPAHRHWDTVRRLQRYRNHCRCMKEADHGVNSEVFLLFSSSHCRAK